MSRFGRRLVKAVDRALKTELEQREDNGMCVARVPLPRGGEIWCPEPALSGPWCEDHTDLFGGTEDDIPDPYLDDAELGDGMTRTDDGRDSRYGYRGDRWSSC